MVGCVERIAELLLGIDDGDGDVVKLKLKLKLKIGLEKGRFLS